MTNPSPSGYNRDDPNRQTGRTRALLTQALASTKQSVFFVVHNEPMMDYAYRMVQDLLAPTNAVGNRTKLTWTHPDGRRLRIVTSPDKARGYADTEVIFDHD